MARLPLKARMKAGWEKTKTGTKRAWGGTKTAMRHPIITMKKAGTAVRTKWRTERDKHGIKEGLRMTRNAVIIGAGIGAVLGGAKGGLTSNPRYNEIYQRFAERGPVAESKAAPESRRPLDAKIREKIMNERLAEMRHFLDAIPDRAQNQLIDIINEEVAAQYNQFKKDNSRVISEAESQYGKKQAEIMVKNDLLKNFAKNWGGLSPERAKRVRAIIGENFSDAQLEKLDRDLNAENDAIWANVKGTSKRGAWKLALLFGAISAASRYKSRKRSGSWDF